VAYDSSKYGNDGTISGPTWAKGRIGQALAFDGVTDYVTVPDSESLEPAQLTVSTWFKTSEEPGSYRVLLQKGIIDCWAASYSIKSDASGGGLIFMVWDGTNNIATPPATGLWDGRWHFAAGTFDGTALRLYVDGALVGSTPMTTAIRYGLANGDYLGIGHPRNLCGQATQFTGALDIVKVWNRPLSAAEILGQYERPQK
jgi:hypothetical protein